MGTCIIGGGIIGSSIAYYLSEIVPDASTIHIVDSAPKLYESASGYAAGFLARDWFSAAAAQLGDLSFSLHRNLARQYEGSERWGYTSATALSLSNAEGVGVGTGACGADWLLDGTSRANVASQKDLVQEDGRPAWLRKQQGRRLELISSDDDCAVVDPARLGLFLLELCRQRGVQVHHPAQVTSVVRDGQGKINTVKLDLTTDSVSVELPCRNLVIASGAWTSRVFKTLFPRASVPIPVSPLGGYSLVLRSPRHTLLDEERYGRSHAIFSTATKSYSWSPEIFSRQGAEIYIAGLNDPDLALPEHVTGEHLDHAEAAAAKYELRRVAIELMGQTARAASEDAGANGSGNGDGNSRGPSHNDSNSYALAAAESDLEIVREGLCFRPITKRGTPIVTQVRRSYLDDCEANDGSLDNVFVAAGHGPWGISLSLGTGKVMAELLVGRKTSANISQLGL